MKNLLTTFQAPTYSNSLFLSFEGIEGAGKSLQIQKLQTFLEGQDYHVSIFREPGGTAFGEHIRTALLSSTIPLHPLAEAMSFAASRAQLLQEKVLPLLKQPQQVVIMDRYLDSSLVYQGIGRGLGIQKVLELHQSFPLTLLPHKTFYLALDWELSQARQKQRGKGKDYFESQPQAFYEKLIEGYEQLVQLFPQRLCRLEADQKPEVLAAQIQALTQELEVKCP